MDSFNIQNYFKKGKTVVLTLRQGDSDEVRQWSDKDTSQLLSLMNESLPDFQNQRRRKKEVWADISKKLTNEGYCWTPEDCRKKWSNMVRTFKGIQEQKQDPSLSSKRIKWPFFEYMGELLALDGADYLPEATGIVQLLNNPIQAPASPTAILSLKSNASRIEDCGQPLSSSSIGGMGNAPDMVGIAVDLASIINGSSRDPVTLVDSMRSADVEMEQCQAPEEAVERLIGDDQDISGQASQSQNSHGQERPDQIPLKSRNTKVKTRKRVRTKSNVSSENPESLMERFITMTSKQNEAILEQLTSFQDSALEVMQERNDILRKLCTVLEQRLPSEIVDSNSSSTIQQNQQRYSYQDIQDGTESVDDDDNTAASSSNRIGTSYQIAAGGTLVSASTGSDGTNMDLNDGMTAENVVDQESLQTLISQDSSGGITFHLNVPDDSNNSSDDNHRILTSERRQMRLENIPSDVNLSTFSGTMPPYFVSVIPDPASNRKPRSSLTKTVSVPLHQGHRNRKIAPRK